MAIKKKIYNKVKRKTKSKIINWFKKQFKKFFDDDDKLYGEEENIIRGFKNIKDYTQKQTYQRSKNQVNYVRSKQKYTFNKWREVASDFGLSMNKERNNIIKDNFKINRNDDILNKIDTNSKILIEERKFLETSNEYYHNAIVSWFYNRIHAYKAVMDNLQGQNGVSEYTENLHYYRKMYKNYIDEYESILRSGDYWKPAEKTYKECINIAKDFVNWLEEELLAIGELLV